MTDISFILAHPEEVELVQQTSVNWQWIYTVAVLWALAIALILVTAPRVESEQKD